MFSFRITCYIKPFFGWKKGNYLKNKPKHWYISETDPSPKTKRKTIPCVVFKRPTHL